MLNEWLLSHTSFRPSTSYDKQQAHYRAQGFWKSSPSSCREINSYLIIESREFTGGSKICPILLPRQSTSLPRATRNRVSTVWGRGPRYAGRLVGRHCSLYQNLGRLSLHTGFNIPSSSPSNCLYPLTRSTPQPTGMDFVREEACKGLVEPGALTIGQCEALFDEMADDDRKVRARSPAPARALRC